MPYDTAERSFGVVCEGGLDQVSTPFSLLRTPGKARTLTNMEVSISGGYKKIYGYEKFGTLQPAGYTTQILGIKDYADGVVVASGTGIYFSTNGASWTKLNKSGASGGLSLSALNAAASLNRSDIGRTFNVIYDAAEEYGILVSVNGVDEAAWLKFQGSGGARTYFYKELDASTGAPAAPAYATIHKERLVLAGDSSAPNIVYWSDRYEMDDFIGAGSGYIDVGDKVTGIKSFRENLVIFGTDSIWVLSDIEGALSLQPVTRNIGCINGFSIQEFGGNLVFLSRDGLRTVAATDRIGDLELGVISRNVTPVIAQIVTNISNYEISSVIIRKRNQYRLYYSDSSSTQKGIIGVLRPDQFGNMLWEWSEIDGWECTATTSSEGDKPEEDVWHGDYSGYVYKENTSGSFDGAAYKATYETVEMDFGDIGLRKTLHEISISTNAEGSLALNLKPTIDFADSSIHQPEELITEEVYPAFIFGRSLFGVDRLGARKLPIVKINLEGSGYSASFRFETEDTNKPFTIGGFLVDFIPSGRR